MIAQVEESMCKPRLLGVYEPRVLGEYEPTVMGIYMHGGNAY